MSFFKLSFWKRSPSRELPGGYIEVSRTDDDQVMISFLGDNGAYQWFKFRSDSAARKVGESLISVANREADQA